MAKSSKIAFLPVAILCTAFVAHCAIINLSDYAGGSIVGEKATFTLGEVISVEDNLIEVDTYKARKNVCMYTKVVSRNDSVELAKAKQDYSDTKTKIENMDPDTFSYKEGQQYRRAIGVPDAGYGVLKNTDKVNVACYYFVVEYVDDYSDYVGATIQHGNTTITLQKKLKYAQQSRGYNNKLDVETYNGQNVTDMYVRFAIKTDLVAAKAAKDELERLKEKIKNDETEIYMIVGKSPKIFKKPQILLEEQEAGKIKKLGNKKEEPCYYYLVQYITVDKEPKKKQQKKSKK